MNSFFSVSVQLFSKYFIASFKSFGSLFETKNGWFEIVFVWFVMLCLQLENTISKIIIEYVIFTGIIYLCYSPFYRPLMNIFNISLKFNDILMMGMRYIST